MCVLSNSQSGESSVDDVSHETLLKMISFVFWGVMYIILKSWTDKSPEWCSRAITVLHGSLAAYIGLQHCEIYSVSMAVSKEPCLPQHYSLMLWSWGYFTFDLVWCVVYWTESPLMLFHHMSAIACITRFMDGRKSGRVFGCVLGGLEITNPLLQIRWFLRNAKWDKTILFMAVEATYLILFIAVRGIIGTVAIIKMSRSPDVDFETKLMGAALYAVSVGFIIEIVTFIWKKYPQRVAVIKEKIAQQFHRAED